MGYIMLLKLYCNSEHEPVQKWSDSCRSFAPLYNEGFKEVMYLLWLLNKRGISTEIIDTTSLPQCELKRAYEEAIFPAIARKYQIRKIFGTKHISGFRFGKEVPALLVYDKLQQHPTDVYPHAEKQGDSLIPLTVTINEFLQNILRRAER